MGKSGLFISYARKDGQAFADRLRQRLQADAPDVRVWQDRREIEGGVGWWRQIEEALERVEFLVIVMTDAVLRSDLTRKEWRYARQQGVCVYPVKGPGFDFSDPRLTRWMKKAHIYDLDAQWETFVAHLRGGCRATRVPFMVPDLLAGFVQRSSEFGQLRSLLLDPAKRDPVAITTALTGAGGFGKTTLACALCHDEDVILAFDDGILWTTLGERPNVADALAKLYAGLTGERPQFKDAEDAATTLAEKLEHKTCLIVIDDVWDPAHLKHFLRGGAGCARLITSRQIAVASEAKARRVSVDEMTGDEAVAMLTARLESRPDDLAPFRRLAHRLGEWPLLLKLAAAAIAQRIERGATVENALGYVNGALDRGGVTALDRKSETDRHAAVASTLAASLNLLEDDERRRYAELAIFPEDEDVPVGVIAELWRLDEFEAEALIERLANASLLGVDLGTGVVRLHDVLRAYLALELSAADLSKAHASLLDRWGDLRALPHEYAWRWIGYHLQKSGRQEQLDALLLDLDWLRAKLEATEIDALVREFDHASANHALRLLRDALRLSSHVLAKSKSKLAGQLLGRLPEDELLLRQSILARALANREPWLRPLRPSLTQPGGPLVRTLEGHARGVTAVALTADGKRAVSGSEDRTLKVWDLETGRALRTLEGHADRVTSVALTADDKRAVSGSWDRTLKVWDLQSGRALLTLEGHADRVTSVALTADDKRAVSGSYDWTLKVWDLESARALRTLEGHAGGVTSVALAAAGKWAVSGSSDQTVRLWDLESGRLLRTLRGHADRVTAVALTPDGKRAVSGSVDWTVKVWDLESGRTLHTLEGHASWVHAVALTPDGKRAVSGSWKRILKVWDLESGRELGTVKGHASGVNAVALTPDGKWAVSGSHDRTLKVWDLESSRELRTLEAHASSVNSVSFAPDGKRAVSGSSDRTLKVWNLESGRELRTLEGHTGSVNAVALTADSMRAVSGSDDQTLKVWDLEGGRMLRTLKGHASGVRAVALTPDGKRAVSGAADWTLKIWDLERGRALLTLEGHADRVTSVALTADGKRAVSGSHDRTLKVWDLDSGRALCTLEGHAGWVTAVALTADGKRAVSGSWDRTLKVWDLETWRELRVLEGHVGSVTAIALTADGKYAMSASEDRTVAVWEVGTGELVATFGADSAIRACAAGSDRATFVAGDAQGCVHFLRLENTP